MFRAIAKTFASVLMLVVLIVLSSYLPNPSIGVRQTPLFAQSGGPILPAPLGQYGNPGFIQTGSNSATSVTMTANNMVQGFFVTTNAAAQTVTTDTAANTCLLYPWLGTQNSPWAWDWYMKESGAGTATLAAGTGFTLIGTGTAATNTVRHFKFSLTACPVQGTSSPTAAGQLVSLETTLF